MKEEKEIQIVKRVLPEDSIDELTFTEFPLATLDKRKRLRAMRFSDEITDPNTGQKIRRTWMTTALIEIGLPTMEELDVYHGLKHFAIEQGLDKNPNLNYVTYKTYEMLHLIGWPIDGRYYIKHDLALLHIFSVSCIATSAYYDPQLKKLIPYMEGIRIINKFRIYNSLTKNHPQLKGHHWEHSWNMVEFSDNFLTSLRHHWVKKFNLALYFSLKRPLSKRLYTFIDKYFNNEKYVKVEGSCIKLEWQLKDLVFEHLGISRHYNLAQIKRILEPALNELIQFRYLVDFKYETNNQIEYIIFYKYAEDITIRQKAEQIVKYFKEQSGSTTNISEKEIQLAMKLVDETCYETAKYIVDFALQEAKRTGFKMQNFQAVLRYKDSAITELEQEKTERAREIKRWQEVEQQRKEFEKQQQELSKYMKYFFTLPPGVQNDLTQQAVKELKQLGIKDEYINETLVEWQIVEILKMQGM